MKTYNFATDQTNTAAYYVDQDGDFLETQAECELDGLGVCVAKVIVHGFYVGSADEMREAAHRKYLDAIGKK